MILPRLYVSSRRDLEKGTYRQSWTVVVLEELCLLPSRLLGHYGKMTGYHGNHRTLKTEIPVAWKPLK